VDHQDFRDSHCDFPFIRWFFISFVLEVSSGLSPEAEINRKAFNHLFFEGVA